MIFPIASNHESTTINALHRLLTPRFHIRTRARIALLSLLLAFIAGCAPAPTLQDERHFMEPVVSRLNDDGRGFEIVEHTVIDEKTSRDFASAVDFMEHAAYDEAIALFAKVIARAPGLTAPHVNIALAYEQKGETEKAEEHLKSALELIPGHPVASNTYGLLLRKNGRFAEAREIFEMALERFPEYLPARKNLGILYEIYLGEMARALQQFETYNKAAPEDEQVLIWIASLRQHIVNAR